VRIGGCRRKNRRHWIEAALTYAHGALAVRDPQKRQVRRPTELWRARRFRVSWLWPSGERLEEQHHHTNRPLHSIQLPTHTITQNNTPISTPSTPFSPIKLIAEYLQPTANPAHARNNCPRQHSPPTLASHKPPWIGYRECWLRPRALAAVEAHLSR
jgi:hypothetical protein